MPVLMHDPRVTRLLRPRVEKRAAVSPPCVRGAIRAFPVLWELVMCGCVAEF